MIRADFINQRAPDLITKRAGMLTVSLEAKGYDGRIEYQ